MNEENLNIAVLHNIASIKEDDGIRIFYPFSQDIEIIKAIKKLKYNVSSHFYEEDKIKDLKKDSTLVFNLCDAFTYPEEEYNLIKNLEKHEIPHTGCSSSATKLCQNKFVLKQVLKAQNLLCPKGQLFTDIEQKLNNNLRFPLITKPIGEDGSNGIDEDSVIFNEEQLRKKLLQLFSTFNKPILVEEYIDGREFNVPIIGNEKPEVLGVLEIDYSQHFENKPKILSYKAKWSKNSNDFKNTYSIIANLSKEEEKKIVSTAISAYKTAGCTGYGSVDLRMDEEGNVLILEINSNCYISPESDMLKVALASGISYEQLLDKIIKYAIERFSLEKDLILIGEKI